MLIVATTVVSSVMRPLTALTPAGVKSTYMALIRTGAVRDLRDLMTSKTVKYLLKLSARSSCRQC